MTERRNKLGQFTSNPTGSVVDRFLSNVSPEPISGCWLWDGALHSKFGYGAFKWGNRQTRTETAHRVSYRLFAGEIDKGKLIRHLCNNPACVNPSHLAVGTHKENSDDKIAAGTLIAGEKHHFAKATEALVSVMRNAKERAVGVAIGIANGLSRQSSHDIMSFRTWKHVK